MVPARTGLIIIRAWIEPDSTKPLRAYVRRSNDVTVGIGDESPFAEIDAVCAAVRDWLAHITAARHNPRPARGHQHMTGEPTHIELGAPDAGRAKTFFGTLFGWRFEPFGDGEQATLQTPTIRGGLHDGVTTSTLTTYFQVENIDDAVAKVRELGGHADDASPDEPGFGRFSTCSDDQGIPFGLHQPVSG
jgi:uncharacterized protein